MVLAAASNITGSALDMHEVNERVHRYGGVVCWDAAALAAHRKLDFNPVHRPSAYSDFAFVSAHKLLGAPGSPGILLAKKRYSPRLPALNLPPHHSSLPLSPSTSLSLSVSLYSLSRSRSRSLSLSLMEAFGLGNAATRFVLKYSSHVDLCRRLLCNEVPAVAGGGVVFYVSRQGDSC